MPDWMDSSALKLFVNYVYTGKIIANGFSHNIETSMILSILKIANFCYHKSLQEHLIAEVIIPYMTP